MYNPKNPKEIVFPHIIPGRTLNGKTYTWNDCNGGAKSIGAFGFTTNNFLGGQCTKMGFIRELGFYGCLNKNDPKNITLCAFYADNPDVITPLGKVALENLFATNTIRYILYDNLPKTKVDFEKLAEVQEEAADWGISDAIIRQASIDSLKSLIKAAKFEKLQEDETRKAAEAELKKQGEAEVVSVDPATAMMKKAASKPRKKPATVSA